MSTCRIVVADDSSDIRLLIRLALDLEEDLELIGEAANGREAVDLADRLHPDLMLLDLSMPVMDGLEAIPLIRAASPSTGIIVVSGFLNAEITQLVLGAGALGSVEKGNNLRELVRFVHTTRAEQLRG